MKRFFTTMLLTLSWALTWADSPLTSTHFAEKYNDHTMVQMAQKLSNESDTNIPVSMLDFLADIHLSLYYAILSLNQNLA